jgi:hypothetical protein
MLKKGQRLHRDYNNILWLRGDGGGFPQVSSGSVDFVFSYIVLQHVPTKDLAIANVREMLRVLKPGGAYCFQFNSNMKPTMNYRGRLIWGTLDRLREPVLGFNLEPLSRGLASLLGLDPLWAGKTAHGVVLSVREVLETVWKSGGAVCNTVGWGTPLTWCCGRKCDLPW